MSFKESGSNILTKISNRYFIISNAGFTSGGTAYSDPTCTGRQFTSSGTLVVGTAGYFTALIIDAGSNGELGGWYGSFGGIGGNGGNVRVITGYLNTGNYTITISMGGGVATGFTPTSISSTTPFTGGTGGSGGAGSMTFMGTDYPARQATAGTSGPTITISPFTGVLASGGGGGGGGGGSNYVGGGAVGKTGGTPGNTSGLVKNSNTYGGGGGGGNPGTFGTSGTVGIGGPGYFWIVSSTSISSSDISSTNNITNYKINNGNYTLSNLLDNYMAVTYNPNVKMYEIKGINNVTNYVDCLKLSGTGITDYLSINGYKKHPFTIESNGDDNYYCNYYNGYYTLIFQNTGFYNMTTMAGVTLNLDTIVVGNGGNGGASSSGKFASSGGSGGVRRALYVMGPLSSLTIYADTPTKILSISNMRWSILVSISTYTGAGNGLNGISNSLTSASASVGNNGATFINSNIPEVAYTNIIGNYTISPSANVLFNNGIDTPATYGLAGANKFLGGRGASGGVAYGSIASGGFYGTNGSSPSGATPIGFGAGAGVAANGIATNGNRGIIIISFAYMF